MCWAEYKHGLIYFVYIIYIRLHLLTYMNIFPLMKYNIS